MRTVFGVVVLVFLLADMPIFAAEHWNIKQITSTVITRGEPVIAYPFVAWIEGERKKEVCKVWVYDIRTGEASAISGEDSAGSIRITDGYLVYQAKQQYVIYDLNTKAITRIGHAGRAYNLFALAGKTLCWQDAALSGKIEIFAHDISVGKTTQLTHDGVPKGTVETDGKTIVWQVEGDKIRIHTFDIASGVEKEIECQENVKDWQPKVAGGIVVWMRTSLPDYRSLGIFMHDLKKGTTRLVSDPKVYADQGFDTDGRTIAWLANPNAGLPTREALKQPRRPNLAYRFDVTTGKISQVSPSETGQLRPRVQNGLILWAGTTKADKQFDIFVFDGQSVSRLSNPKFSDGDPEASGSAIVFRSLPEGAKLELGKVAPYQIFLATRN